VPAQRSAEAVAARRSFSSARIRSTGLRDLARRFGALVLLALLAAHVPAQAQSPAPPQDDAPASMPGANLDVSLLTFGPGEEIWERFGHNAIQVRDRGDGRAILYNYGIFDFGEKDFFVNFARGLMTYRIAAGDPDEELPVYVAEGRWIVEQKLNLTAPQKARLAAYLAWNARPENARYRYDYFTANCSTRVRDALDLALDGAIKAQTIAPSRGFTYRMDADRLMRPDPLVMLAMDAGLGPFADQRLSYWAESFVPMELMRRLRDVRVADAGGQHVPLVAAETRLAEARLPEPPDFAPDWVWRALALGIAGAVLFGLLARLRAHASARVVLGASASLIALLLGVGGLVLAALWLLTDHVSAWRNENLLLFNPFCLLLVPCWLGAFRRRWRPSPFARRLAFAIAVGAALGFFVKVFLAFAQDNRIWIALLLPWHAAFAWVLGRPAAAD
jgi:hypothetical protein